MDLSTAERYGYQHISCHVCGWKGWSDGPQCEGRCADEAEARREYCDGCGREFGDPRWGEVQKSDTVEKGSLCEDCASEDGVSHHTTTKVSHHVARKDHKDGRVKRGDHYEKVVKMGYVVGGGRWLRSSKRVVEPATSRQLTLPLDKKS
jgi:hypothetical protein